MIAEECPTEGCKCRSDVFVEVAILRELRDEAARHTSGIEGGDPDASVNSDIAMMKILVKHGWFEPDLMRMFTSTFRDIGWL